MASESTLSDLDKTLQAGKNQFLGDRFAGYFASEVSGEHLIHLSGVGELSKMDRQLVDLFSQNVSIAFDNFHLHEEIDIAQREIVYVLGEAVETRSQERGKHVKRVAEISKLLALEYGLTDDEAEVLKLASPLHDLGKIGIPDQILNKPGKLDDAEWEVMKTHAVIGHDMLQNSSMRILRAGSVIALDHHEKWNGEGYPHKKKGTQIDVLGRITAVADVFDSVGYDRCYRPAKPMDQVIALLMEGRGSPFGPILIDTLMANVDKVVNIRDRYADAA